jgi:hypothetical protein
MLRSPDLPEKQSHEITFSRITEVICDLCVFHFAFFAVNPDAKPQSLRRRLGYPRDRPQKQEHIPK